ncbi:hypothetical protein M0813_15115 [Anaeramoeba flamelloides]|uniref:Uncharacterized protein n=1 Tax=Anaeramoeba flamelloides TaxID=1746091 RepID=A0ABQ8Z3I9_9EUKA|nr:hypothetical protein M0813_15115 [Anaeramoeba flamelloides]
MTQELDEQKINLVKHQKQFKNMKSYFKRLNYLHELRPAYFVGLESYHLTKEWSTKNKHLINGEGLKEVKIMKECITELALYTQKNPRSIERGVNFFFKKYYNLYNCSFYSRNWLIYKVPNEKEYGIIQNRCLLRKKGMEKFKKKQKKTIFIWKQRRKESREKQNLETNTSNLVPIKKKRRLLSKTKNRDKNKNKNTNNIKNKNNTKTKTKAINKTKAKNNNKTKAMTINKNNNTTTNTKKNNIVFQSNDNTHTSNKITIQKTRTKNFSQVRKRAFQKHNPDEENEKGFILNENQTNLEVFFNYQPLLLDLELACTSNDEVMNTPFSSQYNYIMGLNNDKYKNNFLKEKNWLIGIEKEFGLNC